MMCVRYILLIGLTILPINLTTAYIDGLQTYYEVMENHQDKMCKLIQCMEPVSPENCPPGTGYMSGWGLFGCCGECVAFQGFDEPCTGVLDSQVKGPGFVERNTDQEMNETADALWESEIPTTRSNYSNEEETKLLKATHSLPDLYEVSNAVPSMWCSYHLICDDITGEKLCEAESDDEKTCREIEKKYIDQVETDNEQDYIYVDYRDEYRWKPNCLWTGEFAPKQCKGSLREERTCVCVDAKGETIFGKTFVWQEELYDTMNCLCSRARHERESRGELVTLHCLQNGNYDRVQCEEDWCYCMEPETGVPYGTQLPIHMVRYLPCFNESLYGEAYMRRCDSELYGHDTVASALTEHGVIDTPVTHLNCDFDGSFAPLQKSPEGGGDICVDKYNNRFPNSAGGGCKCARDYMVMEAAGITPNMNCKTSSGLYEEKQVRNQIAFCVDDDGIRIGPYVRMGCLENLDCNVAKRCQQGQHEFCVDVCAQCPTNAYRFNDDFIQDGQC